MLEVNDFNAIRLSLASPSQIRSWSYGEVTKPETINYRTLKPEKDGLFCERIFGPVRDFECHCGKYKRVRYKGIICDKCGVEVARSKVRRERMGHISLAAPVTHIWFAKGVPSRLGLLLDIAPRTLERVVYFAQYVVTEVNEEARKHALELLYEEIDEVASQREGDLGKGILVREQVLEHDLAEIQDRKAEQLKEADEQYNADVDALMTEGREMEQDLQSRLGEKLKAKHVFRDETLAQRGDEITQETLASLKEAVSSSMAALEQGVADKKADVQLMAEAASQQKRDAAHKELQPMRDQAAAIRDAVQKEYQPLVKWLDKLRDPIEADNLAVLTEAEFREYEERFGLVFKAGMGAEAVLSILERLDLSALSERLHVEMQETSGQRRKKATKRLRVVESLRKSGNRPDWMIITELPVLPPDLRPMVQLEGGRFATSDLNDLYRRVINRNNRLKRLLNLGAPEIIIRNEKRMLQEAVDSLIDNGRRGRAVAGSGNHKLKSLSDLLKGKQGRFRQNLLGKRVDYSGRSVIIVGPTLRLHQCGLPKKMALELFKPFVMHALVKQGLAHNIKSAKRIVERAQPEVWDVLEEVIKDRPVLLNRAPTLHRLGIQAFEPTLVEGSAIQLHPLVCFAFNADFDGDQMAVHVPLSYEAVAEARQVMLSSKNLLSPSNGEPVVAPTLDMVLGCYYMTFDRGEEVEHPRLYGSTVSVVRDYSTRSVGIHDRIRLRLPNGERVDTTVGRVLFNEIVPDALGYINETMDKKRLRELVSRTHEELGNEDTVRLVDAIKDIGFRYATQSGITIAASDIITPPDKVDLLASAEARIDEMEEQFEMGLLTEDERYQQALAIWQETTDKVQAALNTALPRRGALAMMSHSGAKGNITQIRQMGGMRGLMSDPSGRIIELPIRSSFRDGLTVLEYFISTHGARKGLADTALRTADSGYLTRRMIDVAQDVIVQLESCAPEDGPIPGIWVRNRPGETLLADFEERLAGRWTAAAIADPETGEVIVEADAAITDALAAKVVGAGVQEAFVRSALTCRAERGICQKCYGRSLATGQLVEQGVAIGIIAAQSIGEPGTQLTMRTFHTGGVAGMDITSGLPRVEEIFEARNPKGQAVMAEIDGVAAVTRQGDQRVITLTATQNVSEEYELPEGYELSVEDGDEVRADQVIATPADDAETDVPMVPIKTEVQGTVQFVRSGNRRRPTSIKVVGEYQDVREYPVPAQARLRVEGGEFVTSGEQLTEGSLNPHDVLRIQGPEAVQLYLTDEVQRVYRSQGVNINDRHIEVIVRQMMRRVRVTDPGDTELLEDELLDSNDYLRLVEALRAEGKNPPQVESVLLGVTKASLSTDSFLAAASFQETTRVLTEAAIAGKVDRLHGLKENVIIGKLIPARANVVVERPTPIAEIAMPESLMLPFTFDFEREESFLGQTPSVFEPTEEMRAELAGVTSFTADPD
ncbi:MAG: DNA-directed RNA polymerase subunit beta' [Dehalococcoidia bacterium]|nr:DNA-directed RNA polymerase subunit beta' [Dehalococcoidia bacterium]MCB9491125.1 DNA-directed RNA polymerase subunit beta' [Dehalococcoidia bacterium]